MALILADRVKVRTRTTGTGTLILENTVNGFQSFSAIGNGNETYYGITDYQGNWEIGRGTYTTDSTVEFLSRDIVLDSSNNGNLLDLSAGSKNVFCTFPSSLATGLVFDGDYSSLTNTPQNLSDFNNDLTSLEIDTLDSVTTRGSSTANNITLTGILNLEQIQESYNVIDSANGVTTHDCSAGQIFLHTNIAGNIQVNLTNLNLSSGDATNVTCVIVQGITGYTINQLQIASVAQTLNWIDNTQPSGTSGNIDIFTFSIYNNSGTYTVLGSKSTFGPSP